MKLHCKNCNKQLTNSLFLTKWSRSIKVDTYTNEDGEVKEIKEVQRFVPKGGFVKTRRTQYACDFTGKRLRTILDYTSYAIHRDDLLIPIGIWAPGMGCCDIDGLDVECVCGQLLGEMSYDCWQSYHCVDINKDHAYLAN